MAGHGLVLVLRVGGEMVIKSYECQWWGPSSSPLPPLNRVCSHQHHPLVNLTTSRVVVRMDQRELGGRRRNTWLTCWFSKWTFYANAFYVLHKCTPECRQCERDSFVVVPRRRYPTELLFVEQIYPFPADSMSADVRPAWGNTMRCVCTDGIGGDPIQIREVVPLWHVGMASGIDCPLQGTWSMWGGEG